MHKSSWFHRISAAILGNFVFLYMKEYASITSVSFHLIKLFKCRKNTRKKAAKPFGLTASIQYIYCAIFSTPNVAFSPLISHSAV